MIRFALLSFVFALNEKMKNVKFRFQSSSGGQLRSCLDCKINKNNQIIRSCDLEESQLALARYTDVVAFVNSLERHGGSWEFCLLCPAVNGEEIQKLLPLIT